LTFAVNIIATDTIKSVILTQIIDAIDKEKFRPVDVPIVQCDNAKIRKDTEWIPEISIDETLKDVLEYWRGK